MNAADIPRSRLAAIFFLALAIRWIYTLAIYAWLGRPGLLGPDSVGYARMAAEFADTLVRGSPQGFGWLGPDLALMPLFFWLLSLAHLLAGDAGAIAFVLAQAVVDSATCLIIAGAAAAIDRRYAFAAGIAAALNPTFIVMSGLVYTDILFTFFVALSFFASLRWMREPSWKWAIVVGLGFGAAALCRILVVPWLPFHLLAMVAGGLWMRNVRPRQIVQLAAAGGIVLLAISPIVIRNVTQYQAWALTPQGGAHLALWVVPLVQEAKDGTAWVVSAERMNRLKDQRFGTPTENPFEESRRLTEVGREEFHKLGLFPVAKAWIFGAAINMAAPAALISPPVSNLPRTGFFATTGSSLPEKIWNFLFRSGSALYAWILICGAIGVAAFRLLQLAGFIALLRRREAWPALLLFAMWTGYVLAINGPVASPKYRLPVEPVLMVLTGAGLCELKRWRKARSSAS